MNKTKNFKAVQLWAQSPWQQLIASKQGPSKQKTNRQKPKKRK